MSGVRSVRPQERQAAPGPATPGMVREVAFADEGRWVGYVRTEPGVRSGWHHHGDYDTYFYVVQGAIEMEWGPGGRERVVVDAGDFAHVAVRTIHREGTGPEQPGEALVVRVGQGAPVINVDGPEPG